MVRFGCVDVSDLKGFDRMDFAPIIRGCPLLLDCFLESLFSCYINANSHLLLETNYDIGTVHFILFHTVKPVLCTSVRELKFRMVPSSIGDTVIN